MPSRRGLALLIVVGVLGILAVLATAFLTMAQLERRASQQRLHATKALLLARSGIEDALARLGAGQDPEAPSTRYLGEDWNADGALSGWEDADEVWRDGSLDRDLCPLRHAMRPSFSVMEDGKPVLDLVEERRRGKSGGLSAGDYVLKVEDESAKIDVNGGFLDIQDRDVDGVPDHRDPDVRANPLDPTDTGRGWNFQLARILDLLGQQPEVGVPNLGVRTLSLRPGGGYASVKALQGALGVGTDLTPYLTVSAWADTKVIHPNDYQAGPCPGLSEVKKSRRPLALEEGGRPPVNLNAASVPVLTALLDGLNGLAWDFPLMEGLPYSIPSGMARQIALAIQARRDAEPFRTWSEFHAFCDGLVPRDHGFRGELPDGRG